MKILYFDVREGDIHQLRGTAVHECDEVYVDERTQRTMSIHKQGVPDKVIDLDEMKNTALTAYLMNDQGKTIDSFELK